MAVLTSPQLSVTVAADRGADIVSIVDVETGVEVLFQTPWQPAPPSVAWDSRSRWLAGYPGGWQVLCPNAGPQRTVNGAVLGFHGETALVPWTEHDRSPDSLTCGVSLFTAPLRLERRISVHGRSVVVAETVENLSPDPHELVWMHHPAFGPPLVGNGARLDLPGGVVVVDRLDPGTGLAPDTEHAWPEATSADGARLDLRGLPAPERPQALLAAVRDLPEGWCALGNPRLGLGVALCWDVAAFPYAWLWQEIRSTPGFPWFRRATVVAVEPSTVLTSQRTAGGAPPPTLAGHGWIHTRLELTVYRAEGAVTAVRPGGVVEQASSP